jgi:hypothetical protein
MSRSRHSLSEHNLSEQSVSEPSIGEHSGHAQRSRKCPAAPGLLQAVLTGMQVCPPARPARGRVGNDLTAYRYHAKQVGLGSPGPAPYARADHRSGHDKRRRPHSRLANSLQCRRVCGTRHLGCLILRRRPAACLVIGLNVDPPASQPRSEPDILPFLADS